MCKHLNIHLRLGYDGSIWYTCGGCRRSVCIPVRTLRRMAVRRMDRLDAGGRPYKVDDNTPDYIGADGYDHAKEGPRQSA